MTKEQCSLCADFSFPVAFVDIVPGLVIKIGVIIGKNIINPGRVDFYQSVYDMIFVVSADILDEALIDFTNRPIIGYGITAGSYVVKSAGWNLQIGDEVVRGLFYRLTMENIRVVIEAGEG